MALWKDLTSIVSSNRLHTLLSSLSDGNSDCNMLFEACAEWNLPSTLNELAAHHNLLCDGDLLTFLLGRGIIQPSHQHSVLTEGCSSDELSRFLTSGRDMIILSFTNEKQLLARCRLAVDSRPGKSARIYGFLKDIVPQLSCRPSGLFANLDNWRDIAPPKVSYVVLSSGRTGSTLILDVLSRNGVGTPKEHLRPPVVALATFPHKSFSLVRWLECVRRLDNVNDIFGTKIAPNFLIRLWPQLSQAKRSKLAKALDGVLFIHSYRNDRVAQAVSMYRADKSNVWEVASEDGLNIYKQLSPPAYCYEDLAYYYHSIEKYDAVNHQFLSLLPCDKLGVSYEELEADCANAFARMAEFIGVPGAVRNLGSPHRKIADAVSLEMAERFRGDFLRRTGRPIVDGG
jgi:LPS sulfotransferase NodH